MIKKGSHLDGVEPINECIIKNNDFLRIIKEKIGDCKELEYIKKIISNGVLFDKSGYSGNSVVICKKENLSFVIKVSNQNKLYHEYISYKYFYKKGLTSKVFKYIKKGIWEILISEYIDLVSAGNYFNTYQEISSFLGRELFKFHNIKFDGFNKSEYKEFNNKYDNNLKEALNSDEALIYLRMYMGEVDIDKMKNYLTQHKELLHKNELLVHGDINPNNIFIDNNMNIKYIDFCDTGFCNKHYDIFWTMFMIIIFSGILKEKEKIKECEQIFLDSYGRDNINEEELLFFKYYACLYWHRHDEITRINII